MAKYNISGDRLKVEDYVSCFTEDGVMEASSAPGTVDFRYAGRDEIPGLAEPLAQSRAREGQCPRGEFCAPSSFDFDDRSDRSEYSQRPDLLGGLV